MADIFDEIAAAAVAGVSKGAASTAATTTAEGDIFDQIAAQAVAANAPKIDYVNAGASQVGKGLAFNFFDEFQAGEGAARDYIAELFGRGDGQSFSENYDERLAAARQQDVIFENAHPKTATGLQIAGAVAPAIATFGTSAPATAAGRGAQLAFGVGVKGAPKFAELMKMGAVSGALSGAGESEGDWLDVAMDAGKGALVGTVVAPAAGKTLETGINAAGDFLANRGLVFRAAPESGALFSGKEAPAPFTPEELWVAKQLRNTPVAKVQAGANELQATADKVPLFLPEAVGSPKVYRNARFIANYEPSMDYAQDAIGARTAEAQTRATRLLDTISPEGSSYLGAARLSDAAEDILSQADKARQQTAGPLYQEAYKQAPIIETPALADLLETDKALKKAINSVKETSEFAKLPDNSTEVLVQARSELGDRISSAIANGKGREARALQVTYDKLNASLHTANPALREADEFYRTASQEIDELSGTFLSNLSRLTDDKVQNVGQIFQLPDKRIAELRDIFGNAGKIDEWNAGIRAHLQNMVEGSAEGRNFSDKIIGNTIQQSKLKAALADKYDEVATGLGYESRMAKGKNLYNTGATTATNLAEESDWKKGLSLFQNATRLEWGELIEKLMSSGIDDDTAQAVAKIYFDPKTGRETLEKILPLLDRYAGVRKLSNPLAQESSIGTSRLSAEYSSDFGDRGPNSGARDQLLSRSGASARGELRQPLGLESSQGQQELSEQSSKLGKGKEVPSQNPTPDDSATQSEYSLFQPTSSTEDPYSSLFSRGNDMRDVKEVEAEIDQDPYWATVYEFESGRNPKAKNPTSSASGGFQFVKATAKAVGLEDPFDLDASFKAVQKLDADNRAIVKDIGDDPILRYAAHYLGATTLRKALNGEKLTEKQQEQVDYLQSVLIPRFRKMYERNLNKTNEQVEA